MKKFLSVICVAVFMLVGALTLVACDEDDGIYSIEVKASQHGIVTVDKNSAKEDETITVSAIPEYGYEVSVITVNGTKLDGNTFKMPAEDVVINSLFDLINPSTEDGTLFEFKQGTYCVFAAYGYDEDMEYPNEIPEGVGVNYTFVVVKPNKKLDIFVNESNNYFEDVSYTRQGNEIFITGESFQQIFPAESTITIKLFDDNMFCATIATSEGIMRYIFEYQEDKTLPIGKFEGSFLDGFDFTTEVVVDIKENNKLDVTVYENEGGQKQQTFQVTDVSYKMYGKRMVIDLRDREVYNVLYYEGIISEISPNGFSLYYLSEIDKEEEDWYSITSIAYMIEFSKSEG